jgi:DNA-binding MarR family transcriptional regulator
MASEALSARRIAMKLEELAGAIRHAAQDCEPGTPSLSVLNGFKDEWAWVKNTYNARRERDKLFGTTLFGDPAWDIMLDLYRAYLERERVSVSSSCIASGVPATTALRHLEIMVQEGLIRRIPSPSDKRRIYVELTDKAIDAMDQLFVMLQSMTRKLPESGPVQDSRGQQSA